MRAIFYTLSALALLVVVSVLVNIQHQWARTQEQSVLRLDQEEKIMRTYLNLMEQLGKCLGTSVEISRIPTGVQVDVNFEAELNTTNPNDQHFFHLIDNFHRFNQFVTFYGISELGLEYTELDTFGLEDYMTNATESMIFYLEPYGFDYTWQFFSLLDDKLTINHQNGINGGTIDIHVEGVGTTDQSSLCCSAKNLTFGPKGNITVYWAPDIVIDFSELDTDLCGVMQVNTSIQLDPPLDSNERVRFGVRGALLNITHRQTSLSGNTIATG